MKHSILAIGSLTQDIFLKPRRQEIFEKNGEKCIAFCLGDKIKIEEKHETFGGGGANIAIGLSRFGVHTSILGRIGEDEIGHKIIKNLEKEKVHTHYIQKGKKEKSGFSVVLSAENGERTVLFTSGANKNFYDFDENILNNFSAICLEHLSGNGENVFEKIRKYTKKNPDIFLSWNPGRESLEKGITHFYDLLPVVDVLLINKEEAILFTDSFLKKKKYFDKNNNMSNIFQCFYHNGFQGKLVITDGMKGAYGCDGKNIFFCPILYNEKLEKKDTLGAGDSFLSGITGATLLGKNLPDAMKYGTINAAHVVSFFGAQAGLQTETQLQKYIEYLSVKKQNFSLQ